MGKTHEIVYEKILRTKSKFLIKQNMNEYEVTSYSFMFLFYKKIDIYIL